MLFQHILCHGTKMRIQPYALGSDLPAAPVYGFAQTTWVLVGFPSLLIRPLVGGYSTTRAMRKTLPNFEPPADSEIQS